MYIICRCLSNIEFINVVIIMILLLYQVHCTIVLDSLSPSLPGRLAYRVCNVDIRQGLSIVQCPFEGLPSNEPESHA